MQKAVFFDRDGIVNEMVFDLEKGSVHTPLNPEEVHLVYGISDLLQATKRLGFLNLLVSNQTNIGLGRESLPMHAAIKQKIDNELKAIHAFFDQEYFCFHHPFAKVEKYRKNCSCRKPGIGMFQQAQQEFDLDLKNSWMIGDSVFDIIAGHTAGCKTILVANVTESGYLKVIEEKLGKIKPDYMVKSIREIIKSISELKG